MSRVGHLVSTPATDSACGRCGAATRVCLDAGMPVRVDREQISATQELSALIAGRWTYEPLAGGLVHRDAWRIQATTAHTRIYVTHQCPADPPASLHAQLTIDDANGAT